MLPFMLFCCFTGASTYLDDHGPPAPRVSIFLSVFSSFVSCFSPNLISVWCFPNRSLLFRQKRSSWKSWIQTKQSQFGCCSNALNQSLSNTLTHTHTDLPHRHRSLVFIQLHLFHVPFLPSYSLRPPFTPYTLCHLVNFAVIPQQFHLLCRGKCSIQTQELSLFAPWLWCWPRTHLVCV